MCVFTVPDALSASMHTSFSYACIRIKPANKPAEDLLNSYKLLLLTSEKKTEAINASLITYNQQ